MRCAHNAHARVRAVICVPWRGGDRTREYLWSICKARFLQTGLEVVTGDGDPSKPFNRSAARNAAAANAGEADVYVFLDADVYLPHAQLMGAITFAHANGGSALPFSRFRSMNPETNETRERIQLGNVRYVTSGCVAVSRAVWDQVHWDEEIAEYGWEDGAFLKIASAIAPFAVIPGTMIAFEHARTTEELPEVAMYARPTRLGAYDAATDVEDLRALGRATIKATPRSN
jgi:hypothetical protein